MTCSQAVETVGTPPLSSASTYCRTSAAKDAPVTARPWISLGLRWASYTECRSASTPSRNSGRRSSKGTLSISWSLASSATGRTSGTQRRSTKKAVSMARTRFLSVVAASKPTCARSARSRYSSGVTAVPYSSTKSSAKSRTTHTNDGKNLWNSCASRSGSDSAEVSGCRRMCCARFATKLRFEMAVSSSAPRELYTSVEHRSVASEKMRVS
mmetsp:Transcript_5734/g.23813  ORF Transcript_5734/g.23813 Transcript_5734/m.23813 type:complete len:212 (+) Transcript_5734:4311-4946(+)